MYKIGKAHPTSLPQQTEDKIHSEESVSDLINKNIALHQQVRLMQELLTYVLAQCTNDECEQCENLRTIFVQIKENKPF